MSSTEPKPQRADAVRNRERIVDAARELFAECGQATQMDDVARRAQVGVGTVYRHFPTKTALHGELMAAKFRHHTEVARRWATEPDGWAAFEGFLRESFAAMTTDAALRQRVMWREDGDAVAVAEPERLVLSEVVGEIMARAQADGCMRPDFGPADMPAFMCAAGSVIAAGQATSIVLTDRFLELLIDSLRVS